MEPQDWQTPEAVEVALVLTTVVLAVRVVLALL